MRRVLIQFLILVVIFGGVFFSLKQINFLKHTNVDHLSKKSAEQLGKIMVETFLLNKQEIKDPQLGAVIDSIKNSLAVVSDIPSDSIQVHIIRDTEVNAFALPGNHIVILSGLINYSKNSDELAGVLAHEIGHLHLGHIEKKLTKEVGLTMLFTMAGGNGGQEVIKEVVKTISSSAFDRSYEEEADLFAVQTMNKAGFDPESLSAFMLRMSQQESVPELMVWMSSHPESKARAATILEEVKKIKINKRVVIATPWNEVQKLTN
jgi:predicted Zn-dependent protease